jgi:hypothetical protein
MTGECDSCRAITVSTFIAGRGEKWITEDTDNMYMTCICGDEYSMRPHKSRGESLKYLNDLAAKHAKLLELASTVDK